MLTRFSANKLVRKVDICASNQNFRPKTTNFSNFKFMKLSNQLKFEKHELSVQHSIFPKSDSDSVNIFVASPIVFEALSVGGSCFGL